MVALRRVVHGIAALSLFVGACAGSDDGRPGAPSPADPASEPAAADLTPEQPPTSSPAGGTSRAVVESTDPDAGPDPAGAPPATRLGAGPVSVIALGDSLTAGEGDDSGLGFAGRLAASIDAVPGRSGSSLANFGVSGWTSTGMVDGQDGAASQLDPAVAEVHAASASGRAVLATVLIGSNDLWYLYESGSPEGTTAEEEDALAATYRANLDRTVAELSEAGAVVVLGLPDDQSLRPCSLDIGYLNNYLPNFTADEVAPMSVMSVRLGQVVEEVAAEHGVRTVDTNAPFWADPATMAPDLIHPNGDGYALLADMWFAEIADLL